MKTLRIMGTALVAVVLGAGLCACSDDDDDDASSGSQSSSGGSAPSADISVINATDGDRLLLTSIKGSYRSFYIFDYDEQGRCTYLNGDWSAFEISYNPYKVVDDEDDNLSFTFNSSGYVTKISYSWSEFGYGWRESESGTISISYDGDHPVKMTESYSGSDLEDGDEYTYAGSGTTTLTWEGGNMTEASVIWTESDSEGANDNERCTFTYEYGNELNDCRQHTMALQEVYYSMEIAEDFSFIGYLGKGTLNLPTSCAIVYYYNNNASNSERFACSYDKNSNGTIRTETAGGETYAYSYTTLDAATRGAAPTLEGALSAPWNSEGKTRRMPGLRGRHHAKPGAARQ